MTGPVNSIQNQMLASQLAQIKPVDPEKEKELKEACEGFEAIFTQKILQSMRQTLPGDALFPKSNSIEVFESMYDQHLTDQLSHASRILIRSTEKNTLTFLFSFHSFLLRSGMKVALYPFRYKKNGPKGKLFPDGTRL
ncbi:MAG: rod-binding protein [Desulfobacter sp.]|nr:rod-binding protein [Desulfobacter sp.]WDP87259.1 MAG: rod-binding protein [Desulfobacter sp.]